MPLLVASMSCASIRNQNVPYRTTRQRQNIHYSFKASAVQSMPKAKVHLSSIIYHLCRRQNIHYSLNSPSRAQDFSFEVGFLGFLGFSGQDIGIFEDHRVLS